MALVYDFTSPLWKWEGEAAWHFITVPEPVSDEIEFVTTGRRGGFGSVRVEVTVGATTWRTSLFPDSKRGAYVLPVKKQVRDAEGLAVDGDVAVSLAIIED